MYKYARANVIMEKVGTGYGIEIEISCRIRTEDAGTERRMLGQSGGCWDKAEDAGTKRRMLGQRMVAQT